MAVKSTNLPADVDEFLMTISQYSKSIDYNEIQSFGTKATSQDIKDVREIMFEMSDMDFEDEEMNKVFEKTVLKIKQKAKEC